MSLAAPEFHYSGPFSGLNDALELRCWRLLGRDLEPFLARVLAAQGDRAEPEIIKLQHALTELLQPSTTRTAEQSNAVQTQT